MEQSQKTSLLEIHNQHQSGSKPSTRISRSSDDVIGSSMAPPQRNTPDDREHASRPLGFSSPSDDNRKLRGKDIEARPGYQRSPGNDSPSITGPIDSRKNTRPTKSTSWHNRVPKVHELASSETGLEHTPNLPTHRNAANEPVLAISETSRTTETVLQQPHLDYTLSQPLGDPSAPNDKPATLHRTTAHIITSINADSKWAAWKTLRGHEHSIQSIAFSPNGTTLASGSGDETIRLWDIETGQCRQTLEGHSGLVRSIAFSPDGTTLASGSDDKAIRLWDIETGQCRRTLKGHLHWVFSIAFSPNGTTLASGSLDTEIILWKPHRLDTNITELGEKAKEEEKQTEKQTETTTRRRFRDLFSRR